MTDPKSIEDILGSLRKAESAEAALTNSSKSLDRLSDESLLRLYENIRKQVEADRALGSKYRLVGNAAKNRADMLREVLLHRGRSVTPIDWI